MVWNCEPNIPFLSSFQKSFDFCQVILLQQEKTKPEQGQFYHGVASSYLGYTCKDFLKKSAFIGHRYQRV